MKRNNFPNKVMTLVLLGSLSVTPLYGCALLPDENANRVVPTVAAHEKKEYTMATVTRTDVIDARTIICSYTETDSIDLSFSISGKNLGEKFVSKGSRVEAGELLATLNMGTLEDDILDLEEAIASIKKSLLQAQEIMNLEIEKVNTKYKHDIINKSQKENELEKIEKSYASTIERLEENLYLKELEYNTLIIKRDTYSIYAPIDGIITYISSEFSNSSRLSSDGKTMVSIVDADSCVFQANTPLASYYKDGDIVTMTMTRGATGVYEAIVKLSPDNPDVMYLYPTEEIADLSVGTRASIELIVDSRANVLAIPKEAIREAEEFDYIYYINDAGIRDMKIVETGLVGGGMVEIISGLEFGESVIKK